MGTVIRFPARFHARASAAALRTPNSARKSKVMPATPRSAASVFTATHCDDGIPRSRQQLTVEGSSPSAAANAVVPPSLLMMSSGEVMDPNIVCVAQTCQGFATGKTTFSLNYGAIGNMMDPPEIISARLKALRRELGFPTQSSFAAKLGIDKSTYNLNETGARPLSFETACLIRREFGISIDWLFFGDLQQSALQTMARIGRGTEVPAARPKRSAGK